jgi:S1-C subfamily serine protease
MKLIFAIIFIGVATTCFSQQPNRRDLGAHAVLIHNARGSSGSGFYLTDTTTNYICLVTASHVIVDPQNGQFYSDSIWLISYKNNSQENERDSFRLSLSAAYDKGMFRYNISKDIAVIKLATNKNKAVEYQPFVSKLTKSNTILNAFILNNSKKMAELVTTADIYTMGYPKSLALKPRFDYSRPLARKGIVAGVDLSKRKIIADLPCYQGNSGGPVFQINISSGQAELIGLVSEFIALEELWYNASYKYTNFNIYNSDYSVIAPIDDIISEIDRLKN